MKSPNKEIRRNREKQENRKAVIVFCAVMALNILYYYALKLLILPLFLSAETIDWLAKARTFSHHASLLMLISTFLTIVTWIIVWIGWDYYKEKKGK